MQGLRQLEPSLQGSTSSLLQAVMLDLFCLWVLYDEFWGPPIQDQGNDWKAPYNEFRFWGPKSVGMIPNNPF